jgi:hypothetical protein
MEHPGRRTGIQQGEASGLVKIVIGNPLSVTRFFASGFFHQSVGPPPQSIPLGPFRIFSKIRRDIRSSRLTTSVAGGQ